MPMPSYIVIITCWILYSFYVVNVLAVIRPRGFVIADKRGHLIVVGGNQDILPGLRTQDTQLKIGTVPASLFTLV